MLLGQLIGTLLIPFLIAGIVGNGILKGDMNEIFRIGVQMLLVLLITTVAAVLGSYFSADIAAALGSLINKRKQLKKFQSLIKNSLKQIEEHSLLTLRYTQL